MVFMCMTHFLALSCPKVSRRRSFLGGSLAFFLVNPVEASETIGKDPTCNDRSCLGVWDGLLADCPHSGSNGLIKFGAGCVSSQDDTPGVFAEPWDYSEDTKLLVAEDSHLAVVERVLTALQLLEQKTGDQLKTVMQQGRYLRVLIVDAKSAEESIGEFYVTPDDTTVQFRLASTTSPFPGSTRNIDRAEVIRKELRFLKLPVLRNRQRSLLFVESDLDTFGPGSASLGPPAELRTGELEGRTDVDPRLKIDFLQKFPRSR